MFSTLVWDDAPHLLIRPHGEVSDVIRLPTGHSLLFVLANLHDAGHYPALHRSALSPQYLATYRQHPPRGWDSDTIAAPRLTWEALALIGRPIYHEIRSCRRHYFIKSESNRAYLTLTQSYSPGTFGLACLLPVAPSRGATLDRSALLSSPLLHSILSYLSDPPADCREE